MSKMEVCAPVVNGGLSNVRAPKVVIIGAGIAAVAAANRLCEAGVDDLVILEATDRVGGRIWSIDLGGYNPVFTLHKYYS